jgi:hypothetical protein
MPPSHGRHAFLPLYAYEMRAAYLNQDQLRQAE